MDLTSFGRASLKLANRSQPVAYLLAILISFSMVGIRLLLPGLFGTGNWFIQSHPAVLVSAWVGGFWPGVVATVVSSVADAFFFVPPRFSWRVGQLEIVLTATFAAIGILISALTGALRTSRTSAVKARQAAESAERRYKRLLDATPVAVFVTAHDVIAYANAAMAQMVGVTDARSLVGRNPFDFVAPESQETFRARSRQVIDGDTERTAWAEERWCRVDGTQITVEATATLVPWDDGTAIQMIVRDVTSDRAAAAERERLLDVARAANRAKDEFLATLSHELRTPLNAVLGWAHMLRNSTLSAAEYGKAFEVIHRNCEMQARLVEEVLDFSRINKGMLALRAEHVDLAALVADAADILAPTFRSKQQQLKVDVSPGCCVRGDYDRLRQIVWHILMNASKFTPSGGIVRACVSKEDDAIVVSVTDNGIGVDPAFLPHMFDAFRQSDSSATRVHGGLGLGLAVVRRLTEAHGGRVSAWSEGAGTGCTVTVHLPWVTNTAV